MKTIDRINAATSQKALSAIMAETKGFIMSQKSHGRIATAAAHRLAFLKKKVKKAA